MMQIAQFQNQDDDHKFEDIIYKFQKMMNDPDPKSIHTEILFSDRVMFSSSGRNDPSNKYGIWPGVGTRFICFDDIEPDKWKFYPLLISKEDEAAIRRACEALEPMPYDWFGIIGQPFPGNIQLNSMAYCSEIVNDKICEVRTDISNKGKIRPGEIIDWYMGQGLIDTEYSEFEIIS